MAAVVFAWFKRERLQSDIWHCHVQKRILVKYLTSECCGSIVKERKKSIVRYKLRTVRHQLRNYEYLPQYCEFITHNSKKKNTNTKSELWDPKSPKKKRRMQDVNSESSELL